MAADLPVLAAQREALTASTNSTRQLSRAKGASRLRRVYDLLQAIPEPDAVGLLRPLRDAAKPSELLASPQGSMSETYRPSILRAARAASPPTFSSFEYELMVRHPTAYVTFTGLDATLLRTGLAAASDPQALFDSLCSELDPKIPGSFSRPPDAGPEAALCDDKLRRFRVDYWTSIPIGNELAAKVLSHYLGVNHPILGLFD
jgi:hypothetical protein